MRDIWLGGILGLFTALTCGCRRPKEKPLGPGVASEVEPETPLEPARPPSPVLDENAAGRGGAPAGREERAVFRELDEEMGIGLDDEEFSSISKKLIRALWAEYKVAHLRNAREMSYSGYVYAQPDIVRYEEYLGKYSMSEAEPQKVFLEVVTDDEGRFIVRLEGHEIPAVAANKSIIFTTGNVVYSDLPSFGPRPHATLEYFALMRRGQYFFGPPDAPIRLGRKLFKITRK